MEQTEWPPGSDEPTVEEINFMLAREGDREKTALKGAAKYKRLSHTGKIRYTSQIAADVEARRLERESTVGEIMDTYMCRFCNGFHIGHIPGSPRPKQFVELLLRVVDGQVTQVLGYKASYEAGEAAFLGEKIKCGFNDGDGAYIMRGALIYGRSGRDLVGEAYKVAHFDNKEWNHIDVWSDIDNGTKVEH